MSKGTTLRNVRMNAELWDAAKARAKEDGTDVSEVMRLLLRAWLDGKIELA